ncbi:hypothetical protein BDN72DRAFT_843015 [Pluteus cervinus]|uniref:Uncharacterized protein n=1 Tax=Pluteus cervinus TaxID=181527 RepID=A0ACD3ANW8_9AGAR|nr:hypothetical protein BDN72DRAFT_843015 [Pluteus cervinus]
MDESPDTQMQETATFQALNNDFIVSCLCDTVKSSPRLSDQLPVLARISKTFFLPAVKAIWTEVRTLLPLVRTMPSDCWEVSSSQPENDNPIHHLRFTRPITVQDCERFRFYAPFIRRFYSFPRTPRGGTVIVNPNVFHFLSATFRKEYSSINLLPSLDFLSWVVTDDLEFPHFIMFLNPDLRHIILGIKGTLFVRLALISNIVSLCPSLESISLPHSEDPDAVVGISHIFTRFPRLRKLTIDAISNEALIELAQHPQLTNLLLGYIDTIEWDVVSPQLQAMMPNFQTLQTLRVSRAIESDCIRLFKTIHPPLRRIVLFLEGSPTGSSYSRILTTIRAGCPLPVNLTDLVIRSIADEADPNTVPVVPTLDPLVPVYLSPILGFTNLTDFDIRPFCFVDVDDAWIKQTTEALQKLKRFTLISESSEIGSNHIIKVTLGALVHFALNCPLLESLSLEFDATRPLLPNKVSRHPRLHGSSLTTMRVGHSPIISAYTVAAIFSDWFPKLDLIHPGKLDGEDLAAEVMWNEVLRLIPDIRDIRQQERVSFKRRLDTSEVVEQPSEAMDVDG